jgi:hypothetical protein
MCRAWYYKHITVPGVTNIPDGFTVLRIQVVHYLLYTYWYRQLPFLNVCIPCKVHYPTGKV